MSTELLAWAGQSFASGVVGAAGGMAFTSFLEAAGVPNPSKQALEKLNEILSKLDAVASDIKQINQRVADLAIQLDIAKLDIEKGAQENVVKAAIANIQTHTSGSRHALKAGAAAGPVVSPITSLTDWGRRRTNKEPLPAETIEEFTRNVIATWDIPRSINEIGNGLLGVANDDGTLRAWTNLYVAQLASRPFNPDLFAFYESLEQRFLFAVGVQLQGAYLVMTAKTYGSAPGDIPESARAWLHEDFAASTLAPEIDRFLWCVEKMVLAQCQWRSPTPGSQELSRRESDGRFVALAGVGLHPDAGKILLRSELMGRRLVETFRDMRKYPDPQHQHLDQTSEVDRTQGIYVHLLCRDAYIIDEKGPQLVPWKGGEQQGRVLPATGTIGTTWNGYDDGYAKLQPPASSVRLRIARYYWRWFDVGGRNKPFIGGKTWLELVMKPAEFVAMGIDWPDFATGYRLEVAPLYTPQLTGGVGAWSVSGISGNDGLIAGELKTENMDSSPLTDVAAHAFMLGYFRLKGRQALTGGYKREVKVVMSCPLFTYTGKDARNLLLHLWMSLHTSRNFTNCPKFHIRGVARVTLKGPSADVLLYDSDDNGKLTLWDKEVKSGNLPPQASEEPAITRAITVGGSEKAQKYRLEIEARVLYEGDCHGAEADVQGVLKDVSVSWQ